MAEGSTRLDMSEPVFANGVMLCARLVFPRIHMTLCMYASEFLAVIYRVMCSLQLCPAHVGKLTGRTLWRDRGDNLLRRLSSIRDRCVYRVRGLP
jgi:hypothetical protein